MLCENRLCMFLVALLLCATTAGGAPYSAGNGKAGDPYEIATASDLIALGETPDDLDKHFLLTADIDLEPNLPGGKVFDKAVIGADARSFTGVLDGAGHTIRHLMIKGTHSLGLFGELSREAEVRNLYLTAMSVQGTECCVGALAGVNRGTITDCHSTGMIAAQQSGGGLVGINHGTIRTSHSAAAVSGHTTLGGLVGSNGYGGHVDQCYSAGSVRGKYELGGLAGENWGGAITASYSTATVQGQRQVGGFVGVNGSSRYRGDKPGRITVSYSIGIVRGQADVGGFVGRNHDSVEQCFWDIEASAQASGSGATGKTRVDMQTPATFLEAGWDFVDETDNGTDDIWWMPDGRGYPRLWWEPVERK